jgi:hypothetical protein
VGGKRGEIGPNDIEQPVLLDAVIVVAQAISEATDPMPRDLWNQHFRLISEADDRFGDAL